MLTYLQVAIASCKPSLDTACATGWALRAMVAPTGLAPAAARMSFGLCGYVLFADLSKQMLRSRSGGEGELAQGDGD